MDKTKIIVEIQNSIREILGNQNIEISEKSRLIEDIGLESIDFVDLVFELEKRLNISFDLDSFSKYMMSFNVGRYLNVKVSDLVNFIVINVTSK